jgi:ABC-2 type transport system ATP-binding protein
VNQPAVQVTELTRSFGERLALDRLSFSVPTGAAFGLLGPNGGGKTTLFRILATLLAPSSGTASICGHDVSDAPADVRTAIGIVFQAPSLDGKLTVYENMMHQGHLYGLRGSELKSRIEEMLGRVKLLDRRADRAETLSGGMKRRVEVAKGLLHHPKVLLLDEPTTGLDPAARRDLWLYLMELKSTTGITIVFTTHLMEEAARADQLLILDAGKKVAEGTPDALRNEIGGDIVTIETLDPSGLQEKITAGFGVTPSVMNGGLRLEHESGGTFVPQLMERFGEEIQAVTVGKPTLEDVFIYKTGHKFFEEGE